MPLHNNVIPSRNNTSDMILRVSLKFLLRSQHLAQYNQNPLFFAHSPSVIFYCFGEVREEGKGSVGHRCWKWVCHVPKQLMPPQALRSERERCFRNHFERNTALYFCIADDRILDPVVVMVDCPPQLASARELPHRVFWIQNGCLRNTRSHASCSATGRETRPISCASLRERTSTLCSRTPRFAPLYLCVCVVMESFPAFCLNNWNP